MKDVTEFVYDNYPQLHTRFTKEKLHIFLTTYKDNLVVIERDNRIIAVGCYFRLMDKTLVRVRKRYLDVRSVLGTMLCFQETGKNVHFFLAIAKGIKDIREAIKQVIKREDPDTVSWFSPTMNQFFIRRIKCHQS